MILKILNNPVSVVLLFGMAGSGFALEENSQDLLNSSTMTTGAQSFGSSLGSVSQFAIGQGWLDDKWMGKASRYTTKSLDEGVADSNQWSVDISHRFLSVKQNTYLAMGLGWNDIPLSDGESSSGIRFTAHGRVGLYGPAYLFGQAALSPWMTSVDTLVNPFGKELELGLAVDPAPSVSLRAGYRGYWLDSANHSSDSDIQSQTDGFFIGGGLRW